VSNEKVPPVGVMPSYIWKAKRIQEIAAAMHRYCEAGIGYASKPEVKKWANEISRLIHEIEKEKTQ
jgi:ribonuclease HII